MMLMIKKWYKVTKVLLPIFYFVFVSFLLYVAVIIARDIFLALIFAVVMLVFGLLYLAIVRYNDNQIINITIDNDIAIIDTFSTTYKVSVYENLIIKKTSFRYIVMFNEVKLHLLQDGFLFNEINVASDYLNKEFFPNISII